MSVRGTTHANVQKRIINHDRGGTFVCCAWDECDRDALQMYSTRVHEHVSSIPCDGPLGRHITYAFCSNRHLWYFLYGMGTNARDSEVRNRGKVSGMLPPGMRNRDAF